MSVTDTLGPLFTFLIVVNVMGTAMPLVRHRFVWYTLAFVLFGFAGLFLMLAVIFLLADSAVSLYDVNTKGEVRVQATVPFDPASFFLVNVTMTTLMSTAVLAMVAWLCYQSRKSWHVYILPMLRDLNALEQSVWSNALDLRDRVVPDSL
ncbi:uncharacterized protein Tco025E_03738 [Trypanosoma conorhini]|uniref:Uncharacterized protein n=1 Tax=Trypanosoma conorhini TaxID=83891 RepID=A0A3R7LC07_9TRYP|nr:uncharacterized protein Tco025E_03738 [Trypanosoma conorhini]RNF20510.1 hypothetical protein Tco025E_03738 [Trypanosoma conorhini]